MLITDNPSESSAKFWQDELQNAKSLLISIERALLNLGSGAQEYTIDTGQTRQTVKRSDMESLRSQRNDLLSQIATLESRLGSCPRNPQVVPRW